MHPFYLRSLAYLGCDMAANDSMVVVTQPIDGVAKVTLNRPEKSNALDGNMIQQLTQVLQQVADDPSKNAVIITGTGEHFCAGADIAWMKKMAESSYQENVQDAMQLATLLKLIYNFPKPIIAAVKGATMGGGLGIIACCDVTIASDNSYFCFSEAKIGLTPSVISPYIISVMGERSARYYFLTAERFDTKKAVTLNLVQRMVSDDALEYEVTDFCHRLLKNSPYALEQAKKIIRHVKQEEISDKLIWYCAEHLATMRSSSDAQEGLRAFLEKRSPVWGEK